MIIEDAIKIKCALCGKNAELPATRWIKQEIIIDQDDESCLESTIYCSDCINIRMMCFGKYNPDTLKCRHCGEAVECYEKVWGECIKEMQDAL